MELLDVGGGFTGHFDACGNVMFGEIANTINMAVARCFPPEMGVRVIAEPGRYFAGARLPLPPWCTSCLGRPSRHGHWAGVHRCSWPLAPGLAPLPPCLLLRRYSTDGWRCVCGGGRDTARALSEGGSTG